MNAPTEKERALANLRHLYTQMVFGTVSNTDQAKRIAEGLLSPAIAKLEQAARRDPAAPVPQGWKLVPVESTEAMARAFRADDAPGYFCMTTLRCADFSERYVAMLAAAPQPPANET